MSRERVGRRVDITRFDDQLAAWYVEEGCTVREIYQRLQTELDHDEWTTELAVSYRLQELGLKDPRGYYDALELRLLDMDPDAIPADARSGEGAP